MNGVAGLRRHVHQRIVRLEPPDRIPGIDLARALAVIGMFAAHLLDQNELTWTDPATWDGIVDGRSSILFATLAGVSLALTDRRSREPTPSSRLRADARIAVRASFIWLLGSLLVLGMVPVHVILQAYAVLFLIAIIFLRLSTPALLIIATATALLGPVTVRWINDLPIEDNQFTTSLFVNLGWNYPFLAWMAFIAAGIAVGRFLHRVTALRALLMLGIGALLALVGYGILGPIGNREAEPLAVLQDEPHSTGIGEMIGSGGFAIAVIGACVLIDMTGLRWLVWPLRALGSMPLTAYTAHLVIWIGWLTAEEARLGAPITQPGAAFRETDPFWPMTAGVIIGSSIWTLVVGRGPLEATMARLTSTVVGADRAKEDANLRPEDDANMRT